MPQLDTVYAFTIFLWTWLMLHLTMKKINVFLMKMMPKMCLQSIKNENQTPTLPWT